MTGEVFSGLDLLSMDCIAHAQSFLCECSSADRVVARPDDVAWCLELLDPLRFFVAQHVCGIEPHLLEVDEAISAAAARLMAPRGLDSCARLPSRRDASPARTSSPRSAETAPHSTRSIHRRITRWSRGERQPRITMRLQMVARQAHGLPNGGRAWKY